MNRTQRFITVPEMGVPVADESDVLVVGAGPAGMAAALAAARCGARTRLVEASGCLGGIWTAGMLAWMFEMNQPGIPAEITRRLQSRGARIGSNPDMYTYDIEEMKILLEEMCAEAGVEFQLHTRASAVLAGNGTADAVITESKSGPQAWIARNFVDASGDGDLAALAGCRHEIGRPPSGECQPMTYMALVAVRDAREASPYISFWQGNLSHRVEAVKLFMKEINRAGLEPSYAKPTLFQVRGNLLALMINHEYGVSAIDAAAITRATVSGRAEVHRVVRGLQSLGGVWDGMRTVATCEQIGVREGRRIHGLYRVTREDLATGQSHADAVCKVHFGVDIHCTNPSSGKGQEPSPITMRPYDIPMRALISRDVSNMLLAGRCISGDFIAHSSYRVTGTAAASGQAAGAGAALSARQACPPAAVPWTDIDRALKNKVFRHSNPAHEESSSQPS